MLKKYQESCYLLTFEKAFDTIEWPFIQNVLKHFNFGQVIRKWVSILYSDVESAVINGGYMTNYFKVSRGVRQGCPLSPLLFVLGVEILAQTIRQSTGCRGIKLPQSVEAKISQFADDTTLICRDVDALKENMKVISEFNAISGLQLNKENKSNVRIKKWSIVPDQIRTNNSLLFAGTIAFCSQGRCGSHAEITTKSSLKIVKFWR